MAFREMPDLRIRVLVVEAGNPRQSHDGRAGAGDQKAGIRLKTKNKKSDTRQSIRLASGVSVFARPNPGFIQNLRSAGYTTLMPEQLHTHFIDKLAFINGIVSGVALYPQIFNIVYNHAPSSFSTLSLFVIVLNSVVWIVYALHRKLVSLFIASLLNATAALILFSLQ